MRDRGQPIRLFGESDADAAKRLNLIETSETEDNGMRNDFKAALDRSEQESLNEIMNSVENEIKTEVEIADEAVDFNEILVNLTNWN